jgi:cyclopropane-fatty-acyl-phospholipid synthase
MSTQAEVDVSYSLNNDFFRLWLDEAMNYTCAVWEPGDTLETAQRRKLSVLSDFAGVTPDTRVLDIGCGWGANLEYLVRERGVKDAHGITLSSAQYAEIERRSLPNTTARLVDFWDYEPGLRFDAVISICMMEHLATPEQARQQEHIKIYRDYFRKVHRLTREGARFALQTILRNRIPRNPEHLRTSQWTTQKIFPGGITPRMEDIVQAVNPYWEIAEVKTRRTHYQRTAEEWYRRFLRNADLIHERWGAEVYQDYERYLSQGAMSFDLHYQSLAQWQLLRIDAADSGGKR